MSDDPRLDYLIGMMSAFKAQLPERKRAYVDHLEYQLQQDLKLAEDKATAKEKRDYINKNVENLAKAIPGITKGTLSAISAFDDDDPMNGTAAIMDICASLAPLLAGLSTAGGPPGMLVGAIFSMVGQILSFLAPKSESMTSKIEKLLRDMEAEKTQGQILTVHQTISQYSTTLRQAAARLDKGPDSYLLNLEVTRNTVKALNFLEGNTFFEFRGVMNWLNEPKNQHVELWPTILHAACQAWGDMNVAAMTLLSLVTDHIQKQYEAAEKIANGTAKDSTVKSLIKLQASIISKLMFLKNQNDLVLQILKDLRPAAQNRGMFWIIADSRNKQLYGGTNIREGEFAYLGGEQKRISVVVPGKYATSPNPTYYLVGLEPWGSFRTYISRIKSPYKGQDSKQIVDNAGNDNNEFHGLTDIWAEPAQDSGQIWFYTVKGKTITGYVVDVEKDMSRAQGNSYMKRLDVDVASVRSLHNLESLPDDPDGEALNGIDYCCYAGLARPSGDIYVDCGQGAAKPGKVPSPWSGYDGIGTDRHYLWVFGSAGLACATHASVINCLKGKASTPRWMEHYPNDLLYSDGKPANQPGDLRGLVDLSPCEDGTLVAAIYKRSSGGGDNNNLYSAIYSTDLGKKTISVKWTKIEVSTGDRVQKLPVFGWPVFESLPEMLERLAPQLAAL